MQAELSSGAMTKIFLGGRLIEDFVSLFHQETLGV